MYLALAILFGAALAIMSLAMYLDCRARAKLHEVKWQDIKTRYIDNQGNILSP